MRQIAIGTLAGLALSLAAVQSGAAADLPVKAPRYPAAVMSPTWTGLYIGAHVGAGWETVESDVNASAFGAPGGGTFPISSHQENGFLGGGQIGYNHQVGWAVFGVEGSFSGADISGTAPCITFASCTTKTKWIATATGRIGVTASDNKLLAYVKGGGAWKDTDYSLTASFGGPTTTASASPTRSGWLFGTGVEYGFAPNLSAFVEYNYMDFGKDSISFTANPGGFVTPVNVSDKVHLVKAGLNYRFNWLR